jgi:hypothetical protein
MRATFRDPELQAQLERDGYVTVPMLDEGEVAQLRASFVELGSAPGDPHLACHSSFHSYDRDYKLRVDTTVRSMLGPHLQQTFDHQRALPCNYIVKWPSGMSGFGLHQDLSLVDERHHRSVEVWVALDDTDADNGQLWMVPGSHDWIPTVRGIHAFSSPFADVAQRIVAHHSRPVPIRAGEAVVFSHAILHFSLPNRTDQPRMVAITDLIPDEADHLHYFGDGQGDVDIYRIDDSFWTDNSPFTLWKPPPASSRIGALTDFELRCLTDEDLDRLVADGRAIEDEASPRGAINAAKSWCHRCGATGFGDHAPDRLMGNVTMLCPSCQEAELQYASSAAHVGA